MAAWITLFSSSILEIYLLVNICVSLDILALESLSSELDQIPLTIHKTLKPLKPPVSLALRLVVFQTLGALLASDRPRFPRGYFAHKLCAIGSNVVPVIIISYRGIWNPPLSLSHKHTHTHSLYSIRADFRKHSYPAPNPISIDPLLKLNRRSRCPLIFPTAFLRGPQRQDGSFSPTWGVQQGHTVAWFSGNL